MIDPVVRQMWTNRCKLLLGVILSIKSLVDTFDTWCDMFDRFSSEFLILRNNNNNNNNNIVSRSENGEMYVQKGFNGKAID